MVDGRRFLLDLVGSTAFVTGVVGWLDFEDRDLPRKLERLMRRPKFELRPMLQDVEDDADVLRPQALDNLRHVASRDLFFDRRNPGAMTLYGRVSRLGARVTAIPPVIAVTPSMQLRRS